MPKYRVSMEALVSYVFEVEADDEDQADEKAFELMSDSPSLEPFFVSLDNRETVAIELMEE